MFLICFYFFTQSELLCSYKVCCYGKKSVYLTTQNQKRQYYLLFSSLSFSMLKLMMFNNFSLKIQLINELGNLVNWKYFRLREKKLTIWISIITSFFCFLFFWQNASLKNKFKKKVISTYEALSCYKNMRLCKGNGRTYKRTESNFWSKFNTYDLR